MSDTPSFGERLPEISLSDWIGKEAKIESYETKEGKFGWFITFSTEEVDGLKATKLFGLFLDNGQLKWRENSKLDKFLSKMDAKMPEEVIGKTVKIQLNEEGTFLTF